LKATRTLRWIPLALALLGGLLLLLAASGTRIGLWHYTTGFSMLRWGAWLGVAASLAAIALLLVLRPRGSEFALLIVALVIGGVAFILPWQWQQTARNAPPIHDITTYLGDPPQFVALLPRRAEATDPSTYGGPGVAAQQRAAYPDIQPLHLNTETGAAFTRALEAARQMDWEVVAADSNAGRIEAVATSRWFGFKDDVVIRIIPDGMGSRIDVRSTSRDVRADVGSNARRIREYLARLQA
jgi:uncharacterized protein (DUF1499 family)